MKKIFALISALVVLIGQVDAPAWAGSSLAPFSPLNSIPYVQNNDYANFLPNWAKARALVRTGQASATIAVVGDSGPAGFRANAGVDSRALSYPTSLAKMLAANALTPATAESWWGDADEILLGGTALYTTYNPAVTFGAGWTYNGGVTTFGGYCPFNNSTTNALSYTPTTQVDTFDIYYPVNVSSGAINWNLDGGSNALVD
jgi:hypothetical protein